EILVEATGSAWRRAAGAVGAACSEQRFRIAILHSEHSTGSNNGRRRKDIGQTRSADKRAQENEWKEEFRQWASTTRTDNETRCRKRKRTMSLLIPQRF